MKLANVIQRHWPLLAIIAVYLILSSIYSFLIPPFEGPDESQHFAYIEWLASGKGFPPQGAAAWDTPIEQEAGQPPLYYLVASLPVRLVDFNDPPAVYRPNPYFVAPLPREVPDNDNRAIHYPTDAHPLAGGWLAFYLARTTTLGWGIFLLLSIYGLTRQVVPDDPQLALMAAFLVAVNPQVLFIGSMISNDIPVAAMGTLTLWLLAVLIRRGEGRRLAFGLGVALGLATLIKINAMTLALPIGIGLLWLWYSRQASMRQLIEMGGLIGLAAASVTGWWFIRVWSLYGSPLGVETHDLTPWAITDPEMLADFHLRWFDVGRSFWLSLGWGTIRPHGWVYTVLLVFCLVSLAGLVRLAWRWWRSPSPRSHQNTVALLGILLVALFVVAVFLEWWMRRVIAPYGRLLFPAIGTIIIVLLLGWRKVHPRLPLLPLGYVTLLALLTPTWLILPAYSPPTFLSAEETAELSPTINWEFAEPGKEPFAELLTLEPLKQSADVETVLPFRLCWRAIGTTDRDYTVMIQIIGPDNSLITWRRSYPGMGLYPTSLWQPGEVFCDLMHVFIWDNIPETLVYQVEVAFYDEERDERLQTFDSQGNLLSANFIDRVRLVALGAEDEPPLELPAGEAIQLVDSNLPDTWHIGQENHFTVTWAATGPVDKDYQLFVHLRDPDSGENAAQADGPPLDSWYPTSWWPVGRPITDERTFQLPPDIAPGTYNLVVGFYDLASDQRFGEEHQLGAVRVTP
ncbi:MAG: glycosyltransferase family 39 protein [Candidatus Promineifilaceae bacterium]